MYMCTCCTLSTLPIHSDFLTVAKNIHGNAVKHDFRCLVGTKAYDILFGSNDTSCIVGYTDSNFTSCADIRKSTTGYCFKFRNRVISWKSKLQECSATSRTEAEYVAASDTPKEVILGVMMNHSD